MNITQAPLKTGFRLNRIQKVSLVVRVLLLVGLILQGLVMVGGVVVVPLVVFHHLQAKSPLSEVACQNCRSFLASPFVFMVTLNFYRFFGRLKAGHLFDAETVSHLEAAGKWWIVLGIVQVIIEGVSAYIFTPHNILISGDSIMAGLIVFFIAWVFREAQRLQEEQELTV